MGQVVFKRIQFLCNYFGGKLTRIRAETQSTAPLCNIVMVNSISCFLLCAAECLVNSFMKQEP